MASRSKLSKSPAASRPSAEAAFLAAVPWLSLLKAAILIALSFWIYYPALHGLYLWDDDFLIQNNGTVHDASGIYYIWTDPEHALIDFFPLTVSLEWLIWQVCTAFDPSLNVPPFHEMTFYFHLVSLLLHIGNVMLIWHLFDRLGIRLAWLGALIFAVHPALVESVAWMAELKNTAAMPPFIIAILAWLRFDETRRWEYYVLSFVFYVIAMLFKTSAVAFPVIILLYTWWKHGRIGFWTGSWSSGRWTDRIAEAFQEQLTNFIPTIPFFIVAVTDAYFLIIYLRHGVGEQFIPGLLGGPLGRFTCAGLCLVFYFSKCILPINLMPIYTQWGVNPPAHWWYFLSWPVIILGFWLLWRRRAEPWARAAIFGFGYFFIMIGPFVGWRAISFMRFGWVMDHFLYVPILGIVGLAAAAAGHVYENLPAAPRYWRIAAISTVVVILTVFAIGSHRYAKVFVGRLAYWTYETSRNTVAWPAHNNRGNQLLEDGNFEEAEKEFKIALELFPHYTEAHNNLGYIYSRQGRYKEAEAEFRAALADQPDFESAQMNLAALLRAESVQLQQQQQQQQQPQPTQPPQVK